MFSNKLLAKVAVFGGFITISTGFYVNWKIQDRIRCSDYYRQAMQAVRTHRGAVTLLGEPIRAGYIDLGNTNINFCDGNRAQFEIPVKGPNGKGTVYFWANREDSQHDWNICRLEFDLEGANRRFTIKHDSTMPNN